MDKTQLKNITEKNLAIAKFFDNSPYILRQLNEKKFGIPQGLSYRIINHWSELGLIDEDRAIERGWRKFSTVEILWLAIIYELRKFGFSSGNILRVKQNIGPHSQLLAYYFVESLLNKPSISILIAEDGASDVAKEAEIIYKKMGVDLNKHHIRLNFNSLVQGFFRDIDMSPKQIFWSPLREDEKKLLKLISMGNFEYIKITFRNNKIKIIDVTEKLDANRSIIDILKDRDYQSIQIKTHQGKIVLLERTYEDRS